METGGGRYPGALGTPECQLREVPCQTDLQQAQQEHTDSNKSLRSRVSLLSLLLISFLLDSTGDAERAMQDPLTEQPLTWSMQPFLGMSSPYELTASSLDAAVHVSCIEGVSSLLASPRLLLPPSHSPGFSISFGAIPGIMGVMGDEVSGHHRRVEKSSKDLKKRGRAVVRDGRENTGGSEIVLKSSTQRFLLFSAKLLSPSMLSNALVSHARNVVCSVNRDRNTPDAAKFHHRHSTLVLRHLPDVVEAEICSSVFETEPQKKKGPNQHMVVLESNRNPYPYCKVCLSQNSIFMNDVDEDDYGDDNVNDDDGGDRGDGGGDDDG
eukprot:748071-Hanusia_phi.AAC.3